MEQGEGERVNKQKAMTVKREKAKISHTPSTACGPPSSRRKASGYFSCIITSQITGSDGFAKIPFFCPYAMI